MVGRRISLAILVVAALLSMGAQAPETDPYHQAIWRLEHDFVRWAELEETGVSEGVPVATRGQSREEFLSRLEALERHVRSREDENEVDLLRKIGAVRLRITQWAGPEAAVLGRGVSARFPVRGKPPSVRPLLPAAACTEAQPLILETVFWASTDQAVADSDRLVAWFVASDLPAGWYRAHTGGSSVDTVVTAFAGCGGSVLGTNDDDVGLQSRLHLSTDGTIQIVLRVEASAYEGQRDLFLTLEGAGSGKITGFVRDESTSAPIESVRLRLNDSDDNYYGSEYTSSSGWFSFDGLEPGTYFVLTDDTEEYLDELWDNIPCESNCQFLDGDPIAVDQIEVSGIDFDLQLGASINGTVLELGGGLVTDGYLQLYDESGEYIDDTDLDDLGRYRFPGLYGGTYYLVTDLDEHLDEIWDDIACVGECEPLSGTPVELEDRQIGTGFDFQVRRLGTLSGRLTDAQSGLPIVNRRVEVQQWPGSDSDDGYTDFLGNWTSGGLLPGTYYAYTRFSSEYRNEVYDDVHCDGYCDYLLGTPIALAVEESVVGIDMALDSLGHIAGVISDELTMSSIAGVRVEGWIDGGSLAESTNTSVLGHYVLSDLNPGTYYVVTDERGPYIDELFDDMPCYLGPQVGCDPHSGTPVPIDVAVLQDGIDLELSRGGTLAGRLTDARTGAPVAHSDVEILRSSGALAERTDTSEGGYYSVDGLPAGRYFIATDSESHRNQVWQGIECEAACDPLAGTEIPLLLGEIVSDLDFALVLKGGVSGLVFDDLGSPLAGVVIHAWDVLGEVAGADVSRSDGLYQIDLESGFYYLSTDAPAGYLEKLWEDELCPSGPAIDGLCDPMGGQQISVIGADPVQTGYDFVLEEILFSDGFETQDLSRWSGYQE